ncbi:MAG TPA: DEAD/DEAH box helicase, partial [Stenomitos sp.]
MTYSATPNNAAARTQTTPDWTRLQRALSVEAERGFCDVQGHQFRFSEFLHLHLSQAQGAAIADPAQAKCQAIAAKFKTYTELPLSQRQHLVAETRRLLYQVQREHLKQIEPPATPQVRLAAAKSPITGEKSAASVRLDQSLTYLKGIGPHSADRLAKLGLYTVRDILFYYPRDYIDYARQVKISDLEAGETVTIVATVRRCNCFSSPKNPKLTIFELTVGDSTGQLRLSRFYAGERFRNRGWQEKQKQQYSPGTAIAASGLVKTNKYGYTLEEPEIEVLQHTRDSIDSLNMGRVVPIYPLTEGVPPELVRRAVVAALPAAQQLNEPLPEFLRQQYELVTLPQAIAQVHFPQSSDWLSRARRRLVFDEFFYLQLGMLKRRRDQRKTQRSAVLNPRGELLERFYRLMPFQLTGAQQRVVQEILSDLEQPAPMNRLVQGDVGSGKTIVGVIAALAAIQSGYQTAIMAPTEVLAEQHYRKMVEWFNQLQLPIELLTGSTKAAKRRQIASQLQTGELQLLVGTHALIQASVEFQRLGLVVIDEQHRFGVQQRALLQQKGQHPHVLTMTAT